MPFIEIGSSDGKLITIPTKYLNRHGIIAGTTGSGKSRAMQLIAEQLSNLGTAVFISDFKGDVCGFSKPGNLSSRNTQASFSPSSISANYWGIGSQFIQLRFSILKIGPILLSKFLNLNTTQQSHLELVFSIAKKNSLPLDSISDLLFILSKISKENLPGFSKSSISVIQRSLLSLEGKITSNLFGSPSFDLADFKSLNVLNLSNCKTEPSSTLALVFLLNHLFSELDEVGDLGSPRYAIFIDEAHYLFNDSNNELRNYLSTILKQIRSKGVSVFFVTQQVSDIPEDILSLLSTKIIFSQKILSEKGVSHLRSISKSFPSSSLDIFEILKSLAPATAIFSSLDEFGSQTPPVIVNLFTPSTSMEILDQKDLLKTTSQILLKKYSQKSQKLMDHFVLSKPLPASKMENVRNDSNQSSSKKISSQPVNLVFPSIIFSVLLKSAKFLLDLFILIILKPIHSFFKYLMKKPIRFLWATIILLVLLFIFLNWSLILSLIGELISLLTL